MQKLLWAEYQKLRRSNIVLLTIFATVMVAIFVFIGGKTVSHGVSYIDEAGWYMTTAQPWATLFVLPAIIALMGSYMICREEQDGTIKSLLLIPVNETKLTAAKMIVTFSFSIFIYLLLFVITFLTEAVLHFSVLSPRMVFYFLRAYFLEGIGVFCAISPIITLVSYRKKSYWLALVLTEMFSFAGLFMSMSNTLKTFYPITAIFGLSGYYETPLKNRIGSTLILLLCICLSIFILKGLKYMKKD